MFYVTGDVHIPHDIGKLNTRNFPEQKTMGIDDYVMICGDFGIPWFNKCEKGEDRFWYEWLKNKPYTTLFVDGNHENFNLLNSYAVEEWRGGKVHKLADNIIHLMRGQVYTINGKKIFTMGGASSHDKEVRKEGISWWADELPSAIEYKTARDNLAKADYKVDYIFTHCMPTSMQLKLSSYYKADELTDFLEWVAVMTEYTHWYNGHYHTKGTFGRNTVLYNDIIAIDI